MPYSIDKKLHLSEQAVTHHLYELFAAAATQYLKPEKCSTFF